MPLRYFIWIIIGSDRRPETKQGKNVRFRLGRVRDRVRDRVRVRDKYRRSELSILAPVKFRSLI